MLSKAPNAAMTMMGGEEAGGKKQLSKEEAADLKIASSLLTTSLLSEQGEEALATALTGPEPEKAVAVLISQIIEMAQTESADTEIPMTPTVWLMEDGAIDNAEEDIEAVAEANGVELPEDFIELVVDEVAAVLMKRRDDIIAQQEANGGGGAPSPGAAPLPGQPQQGGMPNGMG